MARVLITRAQPEAAATAARVQSLGHAPLVAPMLEILFVAYPEPPPEGAQALLFTSVHGVRAFAAAFPERRIAALAVGDATARAALSAGFKDVASADGDVAALADLARARLKPAAGPVLHMAGAEVAGDLVGALKVAGFRAERRVIYRAEPADALPDAALALLDDPPAPQACVLFHSPRGATVFAELVNESGRAARLQSVEALCLSPAVARAAQALPFAAILAAGEPREDALLALLPTLEDG